MIATASTASAPVDDNAEKSQRIARIRIETHSAKVGPSKSTDCPLLGLFLFKVYTVRIEVAMKKVFIMLGALLPLLFLVHFSPPRSIIETTERIVGALVT